MKIYPTTSFFLALLGIFPLIQSQKSTLTYDKYYETCNKPFKCGNLINIGYPFYDGSNHPEYCGYPGFQLNCDDDYTEINVNSTEKYYVLDIKPDQPILTVVRKDYHQGIDYCFKPENTFNTSINFSLFNYAPSDVNITLYYDCPPVIPDGYNTKNTEYQFSCENTPVRYYVPNISACSNASAHLSVQKCKTNIFVPIYYGDETGAPKLEDENSLRNTLQKGFELEWIAENSLCKECSKSKGVCGRNTTTNKFTCYCRDKPYDTKCPGNSKGNSKDKVSIIIGVAIGGSVLAALLVCLSFLIIRRRKRLLSQAQFKDLPPGTPTTGLTSSNGFRSSGFTSSQSTNQSQSISYPSSKSNFESGSSYFGVKVFNHTELEEATENFSESRELGDGGFGTVYYGELHDGRQVAVKRLYENSCKRMGQFTTEIEILARLRHKNLVTLYGCTSRRSRELLLVYEYIPNGTVADHLHGKLAKSNKLTSSIRLSIAVQTADALAFLHKSVVIHRDVKTTNVLLDNNFQVKVADFGLSRLFPLDATHVSTAPQGTPGYVDPEYYQCYHLTEKSDVYSFGVVLIELISSKPAVDITRNRHDINLSNMAIDRIKNNALHELVDPNLGFDKDYAVQKIVKLVAELAFRCLQKEKDMRPSMQEVLESLKGIQREVFEVQKQVVLDIQETDEAGLLKNTPPPLSPEIDVVNKRVR